MDNLNVTIECNKAINNIGSTTYQNICNGSVNVVPWGTGDWIMAGIIASLLISVVLIIVFAVKLINQ